MGNDRTAAGFSLSRIHPLEWVTGLAGIALIAGLLLPWSGGESALQSPGFLDVVLLLIGVFAAMLPVAIASSPRSNVPIVYETTLGTFTLLFAIVMVVKIVFPPDGGFDSGFWLALAAILVLCAADWRSAAREQ